VVTVANAADETPRPRFSFGASFGYTRTVVDKASVGQTPEQWPIGTTMGPGLDVRGGVQLTPWLGIDAQLFGETLVFFGQGRAAVLLEVKPIERFAVSAGVGVGQIWEINFFTGFKTANHRMLLFRPDLILLGTSDYDTTVGIELQLGRTTGGTVDEGHTVFGGRMVFGMRIH
jgi:hypothetical protein